MTKKYPAPKVLTTDDGQTIIRKANNYSYSFWFSDNINDWISSNLKETRRKIKKIKDEGNINLCNVLGCDNETDGKTQYCKGHLIEIKNAGNEGR